MALPVIRAVTLTVLIAGLVGSAVGRADTPANLVVTQPATSGQTYPTVLANSTGWFDVGGFCKVVDVGSLSWANPPARGIPVFIPGTAQQWSTWRGGLISNPARYNNQVTLTTCCRPQGGVATLCAGTANPVSVDRQYGRLGEGDTVSVTCAGPYGAYSDSVTLSCAGSNGPDGQANWQAGTDTRICTPNAQTVTGACSASCGGGEQLKTVYDSCGGITSQAVVDCNTQGCCTPDGSCSGGCGGGGGTDNCGNVCTNRSACPPPQPQATTYEAHCDPVPCGPGSDWACDCDYSPMNGEHSTSFNYIAVNFAPWKVSPAWASNSSSLSATAYADVPHGAQGGGRLTPPAGESCGSFQPDRGLFPSEGGESYVPCNTSSPGFTGWGTQDGNCSPVHGYITCVP